MTPLDPPAPRADWAYFFDVDGTLSVLAPTPSSARLAPQVRERLEALRARCGGAVAIISGRPLNDIDAMCEGLLLPAAGQNGAERRTADGQLVLLPVRRGQLDRALPVLMALVERNPRLLLEDKGHSLTLHYRAVPPMAGVAHRTMRQLQRQYGEDFIVQGGKRVVELLPAGIDKGKAVRAFLTEMPFRGRLPVFVGDDVSDEPAFAAVNALGGHSVKVGSGPTNARWRLAGVGAVRRWLASGDERGPLTGGGSP
jgi:trehalose 6-phosphate phosphatase